LIADELISEIRDRTDIVALIGEFVELRQRGANYLGLCPFHSEKTPSFNVRRDRQFFHCFGCQESGDALAFLMKLEGLTFVQAVRALAERAGVEIRESDDREDAARRRERAEQERLVAVNEAAAEFYATQLSRQAEDGPGQRELRERRVSAQTAEQFRLGYAPASWDALCTYLEQKGHALREAATLGLVAPRRSGRGFYDRFRHRLMFPIADVHGRIVAFSGRLLPQLEPQAAPQSTQEPKYVNSPESPVYKKGSVLFGLHQARVEIRRNSWAVLCEGNFDLVALHQAGFRNAVAPLGTAFTEAQAKLLRRFAQRVTLMFDADGAGRKAAFAAVPLLRQSDLIGRVVALPPGTDPDSYLREHGADALRSLVDGASGLLEFLIDTAAERAGSGVAERAAAIASLSPALVGVQNPVEAELYLERIAQRFAISDMRRIRELLRQGLRTTAPADVSPSRSGSRSAPVASPVQKSGVGRTPAAARPFKLPELQAELLGALLDRPSLFTAQVAENVKELLTVSELQSIFSAAAAQFAERGRLDTPRLLDQLAGNAALDWLRERLSREAYSDDAQAEEVLRRGIPILEKHKTERELQQLAQRAQLARQRGDEAEAVTLTRQRHELLAKHAHHMAKGVKR